MPKVRLDALLHQRGLYPSRTAAAAAIGAGEVRLVGDGRRNEKAGSMVDDAVEVQTASTPRYVSRGGTKLENALRELAVDVTGRRCLDVGASTGGFTDCLLQGGATSVVALDVGYGELAWSIRSDDRVTVLERTNARSLTPEQLPYAPDLLVADVSFISLTKLLPALATVVGPRFDALLMVKPQFEVGRARVGKGGVVREPELRRDAIASVATAALDAGWSLVAAASSGLPGPKGNRETFIRVAEGGRDGARTGPGAADDLALAAEPDA